MLKITRQIAITTAGAALASGLAWTGAAYAASTLSAPSAPAGAVISGVSFSGNSASAPVLTITGTNFGARPSGVKSKGFECGYGTGHDYGTSNLWVADTTATDPSPAVPWSAGEDESGTNYASSCMGLFIDSWSPTQVVVSFGSRYGTGSGGYWAFHDGDSVMVSVDGAFGYATVPTGF